MDFPRLQPNTSVPSWNLSPSDPQPANALPDFISQANCNVTGIPLGAVWEEPIQLRTFSTAKPRKPLCKNQPAHPQCTLNVTERRCAEENLGRTSSPAFKMCSTAAFRVPWMNVLLLSLGFFSRRKCRLTWRRTCAGYRLDAGRAGTVSWESWSLPFLIFWEGRRHTTTGWLRNTHWELLPPPTEPGREQSGREEEEQRGFKALPPPLTVPASPLSPTPTPSIGFPQGYLPPQPFKALHFLSHIASQPQMLIYYDFMWLTIFKKKKKYINK